MSNPFVIGSSLNVNNDFNRRLLPLFQEYAWDFERNSFIYEFGKKKIVAGNEAIKVWIMKTLRTERFRYRAYFDDYGGELEQFIGTVPNDTSQGSIVFRYVQEALLVNPYITAVTSVSVNQIHKQLTLNISVETVYGEEMIGVEV